MWRRRVMAESWHGLLGREPAFQPGDPQITENKDMRLLALTAVLATTTFSQAQPLLTNNILINNWNFEAAGGVSTVVDGWTETGGAAAHYQVVTSPPVPEGLAYCAFRGLHSGQANGGINQTTSDLWKPGVYSLQVAGASLAANGKGFNAKLYAETKGANVLNQLFDIPAPWGTTNWTTNVFSVTLSSTHAQLGRAVGVHFSPRTDQNGNADVLSALDAVVLTHVGPVGIYGYGDAAGASPAIPVATNRYGLGASVNLAALHQGTPTAFTINPALPPSSGLAFDPSSGSISGSASATLPLTSFEVTARFAEGWTNATTVAIEIVTPALVGYSPSNATAVVNTDFLTLNPALVGDLLAIPTNYLITPPLPAGLVMDFVSGVISGTPTATSSNTHWVVASYAAYGMSTAAVSLVVLPPSLVRYADNDFFVAVGSALRMPGLPTLSGINTPTSYTVSPPLPPGFGLNPTTGELSGTGLVASARSTHTITASYAGFPSSKADIRIGVVDGFADDFNFASGGLSLDPNWTLQIGGDFTFNGQVAVAPGGNSGFTGPTATFNLVTNVPGQDFTLSTRVFFGGGHRAGLVFGFQDTGNFWMCMLNNGRETTAGLNTDFVLRYLQYGTNQVQVLAENALPNITLGQTYTLTVRYDDDLKMLAIEILDGADAVYYRGTYVLKLEDLPVAGNTQFGIQSWTAGNVSFNNFTGNFAEVDLTPPAAPSIVDFRYDRALGQAFITWTSDAGFSYDLLGGSDVNSIALLVPNIAGQAGFTAITNTQPANTSTWFYRVLRK